MSDPANNWNVKGDSYGTKQYSAMRDLDLEI